MSNSKQFTQWYPITDAIDGLWQETASLGQDARSFYVQVRDLVIKKEYQSAQQGVHLTAFRRGLALSLLINVILLAVVFFIIGGR